MANCKDCSKGKGRCKRHKLKSKASSGFVPNLGVPPPYAFTFETTRPDAVAICKETTVSFANSNLGNGVNIGAIVGVKHRVIVKDDNDVVKFDAIFIVGTATVLSDITIGNAAMVVKWFENEAILTIDASKILPSSGGVMEHYVFYDGKWSVNIDTTQIKRWLVTFVYENPINIQGQTDSVWVDDGCTIDFSAQNNVDERAIETATQNGTTLIPTSGIPINQNYTSNPITSTTTINFTVGGFAPRYTVKNSNHAAGYVKVEWTNANGLQVDFVPPNSQRSYVIALGIVVKTTGYIMNPITGLLNASVISIDFLTGYLFPPRIDTIISTGVIAVAPAVSTPAAFPNENDVEKARQITFIMPANNYLTEVKFKEMEVVDIDFENPACYTLSGIDIVSVKDRQNKVLATQTTPSARHQLVAGALKCSPKPNGGYGYYFNAPLAAKNFTSTFVTMQVHIRPVTKFASMWGVGYTGVSEANSVGSKILCFIGSYYGTSIGTSSNEDTVGLYNDRRVLGFAPAPTIPTIGLPTPSFSSSANLNKKFTFSLKQTNTVPKLLANNTEHNYANPTSINPTWFGSPSNSAYIQIFPNPLEGSGSLHRFLTTENMTASEYAVLNQKFKEKY